MSLPPPPPARPADTSELSAALEQCLGRHCGRPCPLARLERRPSDYRSSNALEEIDAELADGRVLRLVFKDLSPRALLECARGARPEFLREPRREIEVYRTFLAVAGLGTAAYYGAAADEDRGRYWLFLDRVPGQALNQVGEFAAWLQAARWLAALHTLTVGAAQALGEARLVAFDADYFRLWPRRAQAFARRSADRRMLARLAGRYDPAVERLAALPRTMIHGEFFAANVLVHNLEPSWRVCPVDWETAALGPGLVDLAALTAGQWADPQREALALAYHAEQTARGGLPPAPEALLTDLDFCRLHLAVQWLGWSPEWSPPPEHSHDWLGEALALSEKLGL